MFFFPFLVSKSITTAFFIPFSRLLCEIAHQYFSRIKSWALLENWKFSASKNYGIWPGSNRYPEVKKIMRRVFFHWASRPRLWLSLFLVLLWGAVFKITFITEVSLSNWISQALESKFFRFALRIGWCNRRCLFHRAYVRLDTAITVNVRIPDVRFGKQDEKVFGFWKVRISNVRSLSKCSDFRRSIPFQTRTFGP